MSYKALLFCPDEKTARIVTQVLSEVDFAVEPCNEPFAAVKKLMARHFDALVVDCENEQNAALLFKSARNSNSNQSCLAVSIVEGQAGVAKAFRIGANLVLTKPINMEQSKGTLRVARSLLRKNAEGAKTGTPEPALPPSTASSAGTSKSPFATPAFAAGVAQQHSSASISASSSVFEVEKEPVPEPEPTEAAFLESMPDPSSTVIKRAGSSGIANKSKEYAWQPAAKTFGPMASALQRAAEAAGIQPDQTGNSASSTQSLSNSPQKPRPMGGSVISGSAAASAPAPAKEARPLSPVWDRKQETTTIPAEKIEPTTAIKPSSLQSTTEASSFTTLDDSAEETSAGGSKTRPVALAAILVLAAAAYFGKDKLLQLRGGHEVIQQSTTQVQTTTPNSVAPNPATQTVVPMASQPESIGTQPSASSVVTPASVTAAPVPSTEIKQENKKTAEPSLALPAQSIAPANHEEPLVVKSEPDKTPTAQPVSQEEIQPPAPGTLAATGSNSDTRVLSGIVASTPVRVPRAAPQSIKLSQGVSQGLLVKKIQPTYPERARQMHLSGSVDLQAVIDKSGSINNLRVLNGNAILAQAAVEAVRQWKYKPYFLNGEPVDIQTQITVVFKLPE